MTTSPTIQIAAVWLGQATPPSWSGELYVVQEPTPHAVQATVQQHLLASKADAWLFWDGTLGRPDEVLLASLLKRRVDVWHAGLRLGMGGLPGMIDFVHPTWMLNRDPDPGIEATSWRLSLRACLVRTEVLRQMRGPHSDFQSLAAAALEMGHRYIQRGVLVRHTPDLIARREASAPVVLSLEDEIRFVHYRFGAKWSRWAFARAVLSRYASRRALWRAWRCIGATSRPPDPPPFRRKDEAVEPPKEQARVSVLVPTLERYPYLYTLLDQLRRQTLPPLEIIVVDQSPLAERDETLAARFADLPVQVLYQDEPGQCSSRNTGLQRARGDYILFIDDDDEIEPDLIERHLATLHRFGADVSSGVADEAGAGPLPEAFTLTRASDVFPTNNTLIRKAVLKRSGLFDLAYNWGQRADGDLGTRVYLSGALMILNPDISVFHHHAPRGGLRVHKARAVTFASSRSHLWYRHLPSTSELYLARRYFTRRQVREADWLRIVGTFQVRGGLLKRMAKGMIGLLTLPHTLWKVRQRRREAMHMMADYPQIPRLETPRHATTP